MKRAAVLDLETTGIDIHRDEIVQCAILKADLPDLAPGDLWERYARPRGAIPAESTAVHKITDDMVREYPHFSERVDELTEIGADIDLLITFNGCAFDLPILRRVTGIPFAGPHLDVYRVWQVARDRGLGVTARTRFGSDGSITPLNVPSASRFTGALGSAWSWLMGREPSGEHDAGQDCRMTLDVARAIVSVYGLEQCIAWTAGPLPACVDWAGKLKWDNDGEAVLTFGKQKGQKLSTLVKADRNYLMWICRADFHEDTKKIIRGALDGRMPVK